MTFANPGGASPDYLPCRYGKSRLVFRGPRRRLQGDYVAIFGGTETYGKFIERPFPDLVEDRVGAVCVNFGCVNAGIDAFVHDTELMDAANRARVTVVQIMGAQNMSNRLYSVHPRRNDRFVKASSMLQAIYREVDFTEFHFTRHMLTKLQCIGPDRFTMVREELKQAWSARMNLLLQRVSSPVLLLWFADHAPPARDDTGMQDPCFVDRDMIEELRPRVADIVELKASRAALSSGTEGMLFDPLDVNAARELMGPVAHEEAADALSGALTGLLNKRH